MPRRKKNPVSLSGDERSALESLIAHGHAPARELTHARILLKADEGEDAPGEAWSDTKIADALEISRSTVLRVRTRFVEEGLEAALVHRKPKNTKPKKLDGSQEAHLIALACSEPPKGKKRWSVRLLADRFVSVECAQEPISRELVRRTLKNSIRPKPGALWRAWRSTTPQKARLVAEHGRDRALGFGSPVSGAAHPRPGGSRRRSGSVGS